VATITTFRLEFISGDSTESVEFKAFGFPSTASRVAFERHFNISSGAALAALARLYRAEDQIEAKEELAEYREEWVAFLVWHGARRAVPARFGSMDFDAFLEDLTSVEIVDEPEPDPTLVND
jgi:hypothetical protein